MNLSDAATKFAQSQSIPKAALEAYRYPGDPEASVNSIGVYADGVAGILAGKGLEGDVLPWPKTHHQFRLRPGEVTLWHGINGHGKSAVTSQVALALALQGRKSCLGSFEMTPERTSHRLLLQAAGNKNPSDAFFRDFFFTMTPRLLIYDKRGRVDPNYLFAAIRYCAIERKVSHFFVDSLMKCVQGEDDYNGQKAFIGDLCDLSAELGIHTHVIHHTRKADDEKRIPSKFDAKGSGAITDQVDNVIAVWRNKAKEKAKESGETGAALDEETPDFLLICDKNRHGGWEGKWALWGDLETWHFREHGRTQWIRGYQLPSVE